MAKLSCIFPLWYFVLPYVNTHEFPQHLCGRPVLSSASGKKCIAQVALHTDTEADIFHDGECSQRIHKCLVLNVKLSRPGVSP